MQLSRGSLRLVRRSKLLANMRTTKVNSFEDEKLLCSGKRLGMDRNGKSKIILRVSPAEILS